MQLLDILTRVDGLFWPYRGRHAAPRRAISELRKEYLALGLPIVAGGTAAERQAIGRRLDAWAEAGSLVVTRPPGRQSVFVRLTDAAEAELRGRYCMADYDGAWPLLGYIQEEIDRENFFGFTGREWVREHHAFDVKLYTKNFGRSLGGYAEVMLPLMARGLAVSNDDGEGRIWYSLNPAGERLGREAIERNVHPTWNDFDPDARPDYLAGVKAEEQRLAGLEPINKQEIGPIPLPVGV